MNLVDHLMQREKLDLAKELARTAHDNAALRRELHETQTELFWLKVGPQTPLPPSIQQSIDTIDAHQLHLRDKKQAEQQYTGAEHRGVGTPP